ncbi:MAG TPA: hypothetical protein VL961_05470 [Acidimicrobiales bacterium]|nr:hypothetical protein [Acidimicrobiales bacterium]
MTASEGIPDAQDDRLVHSAFALLVSNATGAALGITFWAVAAHLFTPREVGYGVAEIAAMTALASIAELNLAAVYPRFLYAAGARAPRTLGLGYGASVGLAVVAGILFLLFGGQHRYIAAGILSGAVFVASIVLWAIFTIEDAALVGLRATFWVPVENTTFSIAKILFLPVFAAVGGVSGVFYSWTLPVIGCVLAVNYYIFGRLLPSHIAALGGRSSVPTRRVVGRIIAGEYMGGLAQVALMTVPALLIEARLGASAAAYFQTPWLAGSSFDMLLWTIALSLISEASARPSVAEHTVKKAVRLGSLLLAPSLVVLALGAPLFLRIIGHAYSEHGTTLLRYLVLAVPCMAVNVLYITYARLSRRIRRVLLAQVGVAVLVLLFTNLLIGPMGIAGAGAGFLAGQGIMAILFLPSVIGQFRRPGMSPAFAPGTELVVQASDPLLPRGEPAERHALTKVHLWSRLGHRRPPLLPDWQRTSRPPSTAVTEPDGNISGEQLGGDFRA